VSSATARLLSRSLLAIALCLTACTDLRPLSPDPLVGDARLLYTAALDRWLARSIALHRVNQRIRLAGAELCGPYVSPVLGLVATRARELPESLQRIGRERFGSGAAPQVIAVLEGLPAQEAGIEPGDRVLRIGPREAFHSRVVHVPARSTAQTIQVHVARGDRTLKLSVRNRPGCAYGAELTDAGGFNAYAVRGKVVFFGGLMRLLQSEAAIAFVMGHEIAHHILTSGRWSKRQDITAESRADYIGAYLAERAGYSLSVEDFGLARRAHADPQSLVSRARTHPSSPARTIAFRATLEEIARKRALGQALLPEEATR